jgi:hypothetical protein
MTTMRWLMDTIVRLDGDALVMRAGHTPYLLADTRRIDLGTRALPREAVARAVADLLPAALCAALEEFGLVEYDVPALPEHPHERFAVIAHDGDAVCLEIRRRVPADDDLGVGGLEWAG